MPSDLVDMVLALAVGFAVAGLLSSAYQLATSRPASFRLLHRRPALRACAAVPFLVFAAPFIIVRNTVRGRVIEQRRIGFVLAAALIAGFWSLMSGTLVVAALAQLEALLA
jgi:hypothetical protein